MKTKIKEKNKGNINFLDLIPDKNCQWDKAGDGRLYLLVPRFRNRWMKKIALSLGKSEFVKVKFDNTGTKVWSLIDGKTTVEQIGKIMEKESEESQDTQQVYNRLTDFLTILSRNKFISFKNY